MRSFRRTLCKALIFLLAVFLVAELLTAPYFQNEVYHYQDAAVRDRLAGTLDVLVCGSSHAYRGIQPTILDETLGCSSYNLSTSMMTMAGRYELLKKELKRNPVKLVILDVSYNTLTRNRAKEGPEGDIYQLGRYRNPLERLYYFFRHIRLEEYGKVFYDALDRSDRARVALKNGQGALGTSEKYRTKGWQDGPANSPEPVYEEDYHSKKLVTEVNGEDMDYLVKILKLCRERNVQVVMVTIPITQRLTLLYDGMDEVCQWYRELSREWDVPFYDFNLYRGKTVLFPDETAYFDVNHMSGQGSQDFTELLCQYLAEQPPEGRFYGSYAEAEAAALSGKDVP